MAVALPTGPRGRALALGVTLVGLAAIWAGAVGPLLSWHADRAQALEEKTALARRMGDLAAMLPSLRQQIAASAASEAPASSALLDGATDALAGAALQGLLEAMVARFGASITSTETLPTVQADSYRRIGLRVSLSAPWPELVHLMQAIEQASPQMLIDDLQLHASPQLGHTKDLPLDAAFTVSAFRNGSPVPPPAAAASPASPPGLAAGP